MFFLVFLLCSVCNGQNFSQARYYLKEDLKVLDDKYTIGFYEVDFNGPLYYPHSYGYCRNTSCRNINTTCPDCDYTNKSIADGARANDSRCPCPRISSDGTQPILKIGETISLNSTFPFDESGPSFLIHIPSTLDPCETVTIRLASSNGLPYTVFLYSIHTPNDPIPSLGHTPLNPSPISITTLTNSWLLCPNSIAWGRTLLVQIRTDQQVPFEGWQVQFTASTFKLPSTVHPRTCDVPPGVDPTVYTCIPPGVETIFNHGGIAKEQRFVITPTVPCGTLHFFSSVFEFLVSTDPWVSNINSTGAWKTGTRDQARAQGYSEVSGQPGIFHYCLEPGSYLYAWSYFPSTLTVMFDTSEDWLELLPFSKVGPVDVPRLTYGAVSVVCGDKEFTSMKEQFSAIESLDSGSANVRVIWPQSEPDPFKPAPFLAFNRANWQLSQTSFFTGPFINNRLVIAVILEQTLTDITQPLSTLASGSHPIFPLKHRFIDPKSFHSCELRLNGFFRKSDNEPIITKISNFTVKNLSCQKPAVGSVINQMSSVIQRSTTLVQTGENHLSELVSLKFKADILSTSNAFHFCGDRMLALTIQSEVPTASYTRACMADFDDANFTSDPCCNFERRAECLIGYRTFKKQVVTGFTDQLEVKCPTSSCAEQSLSDLVLELSQLNDPEACSVPQIFASQKEATRAFWTCSDEIFGPLGWFNCRLDEDCPKGIGLIGCDISQGKCYGNATARSLALISCVMDRASFFVKTSISHQLGVSSNAIDWFNSLQFQANCTPTYHSELNGNTQWNWGLNPTSTSCTYCKNGRTAYPESFSAGPDNAHMNFDCINPVSPCTFIQIKTAGNKICNVLNPSCNTANCSNPLKSCGIRTPFNTYKDVSSLVPLTQCNSTTLCRLANQSELIVVSKSEDCTSLKTCDMCPNCTESDCSSQGSCSDATDPIYSIYSQDTVFGTSKAGCLFRLNYLKPWDTTRDYCAYPLRRTVMGCMIFDQSRTISVTKEQCLSQTYLFGLSSSIFFKSKSRWVTRATTAVECAAYGKVCRGVIQTSPMPSHNADLIYGITEAQCLTQGGVYDDLYHWTPGQWKVSEVHRSQEYYPHLQNTTDMSSSMREFDVVRLNTLLTSASSKLLALQYSSSIYCQHNLRLSLLNKTLCSCNDGNPQEQCFRSENPVSSLAVLCGESVSTTDARPVEITFHNDSLTLPICLSLPIKIQKIDNYKYNTKPLLSTLLVSPTLNYDYVIRNSNDAVFGRILTDVVTISTPLPIKNIKFCVYLALERIGYDENEFPILDLGYTTGKDFSVLGRKISTKKSPEGTLYCATLPKLDNVTEVGYAFVTRIDGWEEQKRSDFTGGEIAYLSVILALYCVGLIGTLIKIFQAIYLRFSFDRVMWDIILMFSFFLCRVILFSLVIHDSTKIEKSPSVGYLLVELPIIIFFCFVSNFVISWAMILKANNDFVNSTKEKFVFLVNLSMILFSTMVFALFILMIILFETIVSDPVLICGGNQIFYDTYTSFALAISYRSLFSTVALLLGIALLVVGGLVLQMLSDPALGVAKSTKIKILSATAIGTFGLIAQAIYYLVTTAVRQKQSIYLSLSILLIDEIIPALLFLCIASVIPKRGGLKSRLPTIKSITVSKDRTSKSKSQSTQ